MSTEATTTPKVKKRDRIGVILYLLYVVMLIAALILIAKIAGIQLFWKPEPKIEAALTPSNTINVVEPARGNILDAQGRLLAISCPIYQFYMDCTVLKELEIVHSQKVFELVNVSRRSSVEEMLGQLGSNVKEAEKPATVVKR